MTWNAETEASLRKWIGEGNSFGIISKMMLKEHGVQISRSACIAKASRLGIRQPGNVPRVSIQPMRKELSSVSIATLKPGARGRAYNPRGSARPQGDGPSKPVVIAPQPEIVPEFDMPHGLPQAVVSLDKHQCKYPIGEPTDPGFHFCGARRKKGSVYCPAHAERCEKRSDPDYRGIRRGVDKPSNATQGWA